jgi:hypothetical protein
MVWTVDSKTEFLATWAVLCIEGPAVVAANIAVELGMANGTEVIIKAVVPHEDDEQGWQNIRKPIVKLSRPPICVFVEAINGDKKYGKILSRKARVVSCIPNHGRDGNSE